MIPTGPLNQRRIFSFWLPLAATWLMMAAEGPFLAAVIARLPDPKFNLAAFGVAFSLALIVEAPVIMIMSASNALARDRRSYLRLRAFTHALNALITSAMLLLVVPGVFDLVAGRMIGLPGEVARLTHTAVLILLPWPAAIGVRRFYQGVIIRSGRTRRVAYGTVVRLSVMAATAFVCRAMPGLEGAWVGAAAMSAGVTAEAIASRMLALGAIRGLLGRAAAGGERLTYRSIFMFYYPLAVTSVLILAVHPLVTFFVGRARMPIESLAVLPVINALVFFFRATGIAFQEVGIALIGERTEGFPQLRRFSIILAATASGLLALIAWTPLADVWFHRISGLTPELSRFALLPTRIAVLIPATAAIASLQRAVMVHFKTTQHVTLSTVVEVAGVVAVLFVAIVPLGAVGAVAATAALLTGRVGSCLYLLLPVRRALRDEAGATRESMESAPFFPSTSDPPRRYD